MFYERIRVYVVGDDSDEESGDDTENAHELYPIAYDFPHT